MRYKLQVFLALLLMGFAAWLLGREWLAYQKAPNNFQWNAIDNFLKEHASEDDLLLFEPVWLSGFALDYGRLSRYSVVSQKEILKGTFPPSSRLWVISFHSEESFTRRFQQAGVSLEESHSIYSLSLSQYQLPPKGTYDFTAHLREADAFIDYGDGEITKGEWKAGSWIFPDEPVEWNQIKLETQPFRRRMYRCIWFHPLENGVKTLSFSHAPLGKTLEIFGGIVDSGLQVPPGEPVYLFIKMDGKEMATLKFEDVDQVFHRHVPLPVLDRSPRQMQFEVRTSKQGYRHFCFSAWSEN